MRKIKIGVAGLGFMGSTHLKALRNIAAVELAAVVSSDEGKLSGDLSGIHGNLGGPGEKFDFSEVRKYRSVNEAIADPDLDALDLCLPSDQHAPATIAALRAGKHVFVEKPMALDASQCQAMIDEARNQKRVLMVAQVLRFFPAYTLLRDQLQNGGLGQVRSALFRRRCAAPGWGKWAFDASKSGGGVFDLLIHDVDMCLHLFGPPKSVSAQGYVNLEGGMDTITASLEYDSISDVVITGGWHHRKSYPFSMEYTVSADGGTVDYSSAGRPATLYKADGEVEVLTEPAIDGYQAELEYFIDCCRHNRWPVVCAPEQSAMAVSLTRLIEASRAKGGERLLFANKSGKQ